MIVAALIARLEAVAAVTAISSTRLYQAVLPQSPTLPALRLQRIGEIRESHLRGGVALLRARVQIDAYGGGDDPIGAAQALDAAVVGDASGSALVGWTGTAAGLEVVAVLPVDARENFEGDELQQYRVSRDVIAWWRAP